MIRGWQLAHDELKALILETQIEEYYIRIAQNGVTEVYWQGLLMKRWHHKGLYDEIRDKLTQQASEN